MKDTASKLSPLTLTFHWVLALGMIGMIAFGLYLEGLPRDADKGGMLSLHKSVGILILVLAALRIGWRTLNGWLTPIYSDKGAMPLLAKFIHILLLVGTLMMPISGIIMSLAGGSGLSLLGWELIPTLRGTDGFTRNEAMGQIGNALHGLGGKLLILAIGLHIAGALKHHLIDKDGTLKRMLGRTIWI